MYRLFSGFPEAEFRLTVTHPAAPDDLPAVAAFIARLNATPLSQSLHCPTGTPRRVRAALEHRGSFPAGWAQSFVVSTDPSAQEIRAVFGCQFDPDHTLGWLWGPWLNDPLDWAALGPALVDFLLDRLPRSVGQIDAFLHTENRTGLRFLQRRGFSLGPITHIYVAPRPAISAEISLYPELRPAHEVAFARLHADTFPASGGTPSEILLTGRDEEHAIFAATDGLRLLGSVCVSVNHAPLEGFIDYLAVKPAARGKGIGIRLLQTALRWIFDERRLPQAALTVSDWRQGARRLYEQSGFELQASGIAARLKLRC